MHAEFSDPGAKMPEAEADAPSRTETLGGFAIRGSVWYLPDVQFWEPRISIDRLHGDFEEFQVPCGPECYRKSSDAAFQVGWATARQWLDGGRIPWKQRRQP